MHILYYAAHREKTGNEFIQALKTSVPGQSVERYATVEGLTRRLLRKLDIKTVAVVYAASDEDLIDIYYIQHLLSKVLLVLVLPDADPLTVAMGHRLHPCYMCTVDSELSGLVAALTSIVRRGYAPESMEAFRNPFEALGSPGHPGAQRDSWMFAAA